MPRSTQHRRIARTLERLGLLLAADGVLPSVSLLIAGEPIRGSWWGHPAAGAIFAVCEWLESHDDVLATKLVNGKVTYVQRRLWPALLRVVTSKRAWQRRGLSPAATLLLAEVARRRRVRADALKQPARALRQPVQELEKRLLVMTSSVHTESGKHVKQLESWRAWMQRNAFAPKLPSWESAVSELEAAGTTLVAAAAPLARRPAARGTSASVRVRFPWQD